MGQCGFKADRYNPCTFFDEERGMRCLVHGDDFVCAGDTGKLKWFKKKAGGKVRNQKHDSRHRPVRR